MTNKEISEISDHSAQSMVPSPSGPSISLTDALSRLVVIRPANPSEPRILARALTAEEREKAEARRTEIADQMAERNTKALANLIVKLLSAFPGRETVDNAKELTALYVEVLSDWPFWAVREAVNDWLRGEVPDGASLTFRPSTAQLARSADHRCRSLRVEAATLAEVLAAVAADGDGKVVRMPTAPA